MKILILGANGFIGHNLIARILDTTDWMVYSLDLDCNKLNHYMDNHKFKFIEGDISISKEWIDYHIKKCDVIFPLVAIATPKTYITSPLKVFELDFVENLRIIQQCVRYNKRVIFPSTSEVYGMCPDKEFHEDSSHFVLGPINMHRWIYSCSKQLIDRVIWAYGIEKELQFTLIRPFNWIGPNLDNLEVAKEGSSRVVTQFIYNLIKGEPIKLVSGGQQKRSFTYVDDGIDCLMKIIENKNGICDGQIFNIGNPDNQKSIKELATLLLRIYKQYPNHNPDKDASQIVEVSEIDYYGVGYQDILSRKPSIEKAKQLLGWTPKVCIKDALKMTLDYYMKKGKNQ